GAFGTEGMQVKRIKGMFSFLARKDQNIPGLGLDLLGLASVRLRDNDDIGTLGAQVASDVPILMQFYQRYFRKHGSFSVFEREVQCTGHTVYVYQSPYLLRAREPATAKRKR